MIASLYDFAVKRGRFDRNPVAAVRQRPEPPGRDWIVSPSEFRTLWDKAEGDREMRAFLALAGTMTMRKSEILSLRWDRIHLDDAPYATLVRTKTGHQRHIPIPQSIVKTLKALLSHGTGEYLFPSRPTARCPEPRRPYRWDFGKQFRALTKAAGIVGQSIYIVAAKLDRIFAFRIFIFVPPSTRRRRDRTPRASSARQVRARAACAS